MFDTIKSLIGLRIDDNRVIEFMEKNGFKYPKKPFLSNRSSDTSYWVENKKLGIDLLFNIQNYLENYPLIQGGKKGIFVPILNSARWYNNKSKTEFPQNLDFGSDFDTLNIKLGEPTLKSSDISPIWLNDDGSESFYRWRITLDSEKDIVWGVEFKDTQTISDFTLGLKYRHPLFQLYYEVYYDNFDAFIKRKDFYETAHLMFLQWAIERDLIKKNEVTATVAEAVKEGRSPVTEWVRVLNKGYIIEEDFSAEHRFISAYINNLSGHDILYTRDVAYTFLESAELKENYFSKAATEQLNKLEYNKDNYEIVRALIDRRMAEYKDHKFSKSKQL